MIQALRRAARRAGLPPGTIRSDLPEAIGLISPVPPDLVRHWRRALRRSERTLRTLPSISGPRVGFVTTVGKGVNNPGYAAVLAWALRLRGADPFFVYCDSWLEGCEHPTIAYFTPERFIAEGPRPLCEGCFRGGQNLYRVLGFPVHPLSGTLSADDLARISRMVAALPPERYFDLVHEGMPLGSQVEATAVRFFYTHTVDPTEPRAALVTKRLVHGAVMMAEATRGLIDTTRADILAPQWGLYASRGAAMLAARAAGIRTVTWGHGYVEETLMYGEGDHAFIELSHRSTGPWEGIALTAERERRLERHLKARVSGTYRVVNPGAIEEEERVVAGLGLRRDRPIVALYTNVGYDAKLLYDTPLHPDVPSWIFDSIERFAGREEQLVIRVHPAEVWLPFIIDKEQTVRAIRERFPRLPPNVRVVPPDSKLSSYALARLAKVGIAFGSLIGLELTASGLGMIMCGRGAYWNKGFTYDVRSAADYDRYLASIDDIARPNPARTEAARRFAYYFYELRQIPFLQWNHDFHAGLRLPPWWRVFRSLDDLRPGVEPNLDRVCEQILTGREALAHWA